MSFDPRITPARPDLAAKHLDGKVEAARFVEGEEREVIDAQAPVRRAPAPDAPRDDRGADGRARHGLRFDDEGWAWGQLASDGYVGWLPANALCAPRAAPTHKVSALRTLVFPGPSIKLPPVEAPPLGSRLAVCAIRIACGRAGRLSSRPPPRAARPDETDFVAVAERFLGTPYLWGGKTNIGLDCSGLVQIALTPAASLARATATCRSRRWARRSIDRPRCGAAIWCSGRAMSRSCATAQASCARQRLPHGGRDRADCRGARAHRGGGSEVTSVKRL